MEFLMIVWLTSFPRSGNTFLRIVLHRHFGIRSAVVYDFDGVAERVGRELVGFEDRPASYDEMRGSDELHFIKTHRQRDDRIGDEPAPTIDLREVTQGPVRSSSSSPS
jgi:hypothetical protein